MYRHSSNNFYNILGLLIMPIGLLVVCGIFIYGQVYYFMKGARE